MEESIMNSNMSKAPLLSVIIPVYNVEQYLEEALLSITEQSFCDIDIICINDGSTDQSAKILESFSRKDKRIRVIDQENHGLSSARNRGIDAAVGKYIYFFDSDDILEHTAFEQIIVRMEQDELEMLFFDVMPFAEEGVSENTLKTYEKYYNRSNDYPGVMTGLELMVKQLEAKEFLVGAWGYVSLRSFVEKNHLRFEAGLLHEDNLYTFCSMVLARRAGYMDQMFFKRRLRSGSITQSKKTFAHAYGYFFTHLKALDFYRKVKSDGESLNEVQDAAESLIITRRIGNWIKSARNVYSILTAEERDRVKELSAEEQVLFDIYIADVCVQKEKADKKAKDAEIEAETARKEAQKYKTEAEKKQKRIQDIEGSRAYRFGTAVATPVRKIKKKSLSEKELKPETEIENTQDEKNKTAVSGRQKSHPKTIWFFGSPSHGNLGDHMIAEASLSFFQERHPGCVVKEIPRNDVIGKLPEIEKEILAEDVIYYIGGGNLGNYWPDNEKVRQEIIRRFPDHKKVILPQSIQFTDDESGQEALKQACEVYADQNLLLVCRGKASLDFARNHFSCKSVMTPDMVMGSTVPSWWKKNTSHSGAVLCLRRDKERFLSDDDNERIQRVLLESFDPQQIQKTDMVRPYAVPPGKRRAELAGQYRLFSGAEVVITDRLHCMIFCAQTETPCVVFPNDHHKITECYEWIADLPYVRLVQDINKLPEALTEVRNTTVREYPLRKMRTYFSEISL